MSITAYLYSNFDGVVVVVDPNGSGVDQTEIEFDLNGGTPEEVLLSEGYEVLGDWQSLFTDGKVADLVEL